MSETNAAAIVDRLETLYRSSVTALREDLEAFLATRSPPDPAAAGGRRLRLSGAAPDLCRQGAGAAPAARLRPLQPARRLCDHHHPAGPVPRLPDRAALPADGRLRGRGRGVAAPDQEIPFPYVLDGRRPRRRRRHAPPRSRRHFPATELASIGDEVADGFWSPDRARRGRWPCSTACAPTSRLARLTHYTGTPAEHVQPYVLFTNYHRYVDEFVRWGAASSCSATDSPYEALVLRRRRGDHQRHADPERAVADSGLAAPPDAGLPPDGARPARRLADQHRRRPLQRQDHHRPPGGAATRGLADDRPLRRPALHPDHRRLCAGPRLSARRPCAGRRAAAGDPDPADRRGAGRPAAGRRAWSPARAATS